MNPPKFTVSPPFDATSPGDCELRTSDGFKFKVFKTILSLGSPVFRDMFRIPQADDSTEKSKPIPVIDVTETAAVVHILLTMMYPSGVPDVSDFRVAHEVAIACDKYSIEVDRLRFIVRGSGLFSSNIALPLNPLRMYALAWRLQMEPEAKLASRYMYSLDLADEKVAAEMINLSGTVKSLTALFKLREDREDALDDIIRIIRLVDNVCLGCGGYNLANGVTSPKSHEDAKGLRKKTRKALSTAYPTYQSLRKELLMGRKMRCPHLLEVAPKITADESEKEIQRYPQEIKKL